MRSLYSLVCFLLLAVQVLSSRSDDSWSCPETGKTFCTGAMPTPDHQLAQAPIFAVPGLPPKHVAYVPKVRSYFGNNRYGVCVTSEEAFAKSCWIAGVQPEIDIPESEVIRWARSHGVLNGAALGPVCDWMAQKGFQVDKQLYNDGAKSLVDFRDETVLKAAIACGPVKVAIPARMLGSGAGSRDGWLALGGNSRGSDHCVSLCGYGDAKWLYGELGVDLPAKLNPDTDGYLCYTWSTIGFVDSAWVKGNVREAWLRTPTTVGIPPIAPPHAPGPVIRGFHLLMALLFGLMLGVLLWFLWPAIRNLLRWFKILPPGSGPAADDASKLA